MKKRSPIGILGFGEVGQAIAKFYKHPRVKDLTRNDDLTGVEVLHVCIPWSETFIDVVKKEIERSQPQVTIIHSAVPPKTTQKVAGGLSKKLAVVHSPIRGIHPHLHKGIKTFVKYIGADDKKAGQLAQRHFAKLKVATKVVYPSITTELGKLLDTTYYALIIAWHGESKKWCDALGVDFDVVVSDFNKTYNEGYKKLGKHNVIRPVLLPPQGFIGGHCLIPNAKLLKKYVDRNNKALDLILSYEKKSSKK